MTELRIHASGGAYPIKIGAGALEGFGDMLALQTKSKAAIVSDETVWALHGGRLERALRAAGIGYFPVVLPPGEETKSLRSLERLWREFAKEKLLRSEPVLAFGGGVVGDLAGFAAATYMRGVPFIQIPTTLLAQVDSGVGGKVAIDLPEGKNLAGSFYQPKFVVADTELLKTLPEREVKNGLSEIAKYAAIGEDRLLPLLSGMDAALRHLETIVALCCACKAGYVEKDERDEGERMMLNFGHTFGHAIEKYYEYQKYSHGEAVVLGMALAARAGILLGVTEKSAWDALKNLLDALGLSYSFEGDLQKILPLMAGDKKNSGEEITLVLLKKMGSPFLYKIKLKELLHLFSGEGSA